MTSTPVCPTLDILHTIKSPSYVSPAGLQLNHAVDPEVYQSMMAVLKHRLPAIPVSPQIDMSPQTSLTQENDTEEESIPPTHDYTAIGVYQHTSNEDEQEQEEVQVQGIGGLEPVQQEEDEAAEEDTAAFSPIPTILNTSNNNIPTLPLVQEKQQVAAAAAVAAPSRVKSSSGAGAHPGWTEHMCDLQRRAVGYGRLFEECHLHAADYGSKKQHDIQRNFYCLTCGPLADCAMCKYCLPEHSQTCGGTVHQVYRYMYHEVLRISTFGKAFNFDGIQAYSANEKLSVHVNPRPQPKTKSPANFTALCQGCNRNLSPEWKFCSLACKLGIVQPEDIVGKGPTGGGGSCAAPVSVADKPVTLKRRQAGGSYLAGSSSSSQTSLDEGELEEYQQLYHHQHVVLSGAKRRKAMFPQRSASM